jgi:hypothetical protein
VISSVGTGGVYLTTCPHGQALGHRVTSALCRLQCYNKKKILVPQGLKLLQRPNVRPVSCVQFDNGVKTTSQKSERTLPAVPSDLVGQYLHNSKPGIIFLFLFQVSNCLQLHGMF